MGRAAGSIRVGAGRVSWSVVCGGLAGAAGSRLARHCVSGDPGESAAGDAKAMRVTIVVRNEELVNGVFAGKPVRAQAQNKGRAK